MDEFKKGLSSLFGKAEDKVLGAKINSILCEINADSVNELCQKINSIDKDTLLNKLSEYDKSKLEDMNINANELKAKLSEIDLAKVSQMLGESGKEVVDKIVNILNQN